MKLLNVHNYFFHSSALLIVKSTWIHGPVAHLGDRIEQFWQHHLFRSDQEPLQRHDVGLYSLHLLQSVLSRMSPLKAMEEWRRINLQFFKNSSCHFLKYQKIVVTSDLEVKT